MDHIFRLSEPMGERPCSVLGCLGSVPSPFMQLPVTMHHSPVIELSFLFVPGHLFVFVGMREPAFEELNGSVRVE